MGGGGAHCQTTGMPDHRNAREGELEDSRREGRHTLVSRVKTNALTERRDTLDTSSQAGPGAHQVEGKELIKDGLIG